MGTIDYSSLFQHLQTGIENAIHMHTLAGLLNTSDRMIRKMVEQARKDGYQIIGDTAGYYLPDENGSEYEKARFVRARQQMAKTIFTTLKPFKEED